MRICLIGPTYPFRGGISHYTTLLYHHLKKKNNTLFLSFTRQYPKWLFPGKTDIDPSREHIQEQGVQKVLDSMNPFTWLKSAQIIIKHNPELVIIPWWVSFWAPQFWTISLLIKVLTNSKILFLCHNVVEHESKWIDRILTRFVLKKGDLFIVHSSEDQNNLKAIIPDAIVRKTFHPTYDVFNMADFDTDKIRTRCKIKGNILLFFGFVRPYKGLKYLIKALPEIIKTNDVTLMIVGEFWKDKDEYIALIKDLGLEKYIIIVDEYVPNEEVGDYFSAADLVVQPYTSATGSGVVQTAFAFGKPVIATKVGCLPEVIDHSETGFLVEPEDPHGIEKAVNQYFRQIDKDYMKSNIEKENYRFSWDRMIEVIEELSNNRLK